MTFRPGRTDAARRNGCSQLGCRRIEKPAICFVGIGWPAVIILRFIADMKNPVDLSELQISFYRKNEYRSASHLDLNRDGRNGIVYVAVRRCRRRIHDLLASAGMLLNDFYYIIHLFVFKAQKERSITLLQETARGCELCNIIPIFIQFI